MLVLSRGEGEGVLIGADVRVVVLSVVGRHVRLAIDAPKRVPILRDELVRINIANPGETDVSDTDL